jgi:polyadenylate-binding protein
MATQNPTQTIKAEGTVEENTKNTPMNGADKTETAAPQKEESAPRAPVAQNATSTAATSLYVGELQSAVTETMLFEFFSMVGPVSSIRVCRDAVSRRSLGYAYVNYHNPIDAERALDTLNYTLILGKPCRIMWSQRDPSLRRTGAGNIFIKNLDPTIDNKALHDTFSAFGNILSCKVATDGAGKSKGYGFVHFESSEAADSAIAQVNGMMLNDQIVYVGHHIPIKDRGDKAAKLDETFTNVYVKNLDNSVTDAQLRELFEKFGTITSAAVSVDDQGNSKGFGFINYESHEAAIASVEALSESEQFGKKLTVCRAQMKSERQELLTRQFEQAKQEKLLKTQNVNLYVKNLDVTVDDQTLNQTFEPFGAITSAKIMRDENGQSKGFGFVCFANPDHAAKAIHDMNGFLLFNKPLYVSLAQRKEERRNFLESQRHQARLHSPGAPNMFPGNPMFFPNAPFPPANQANFGYNGPQQGRFANNQRQRWNPNQAPNAQQYAPGFLGHNQGSGPRQPKQQTQQASAPKPAAQAEPEDPNALTAARLAAADPETQKNMLGEHLFPLVSAIDAELAGKITGMLLEMDNGELLYLIENSEALTAKVNEALNVLSNHVTEE